jgi:L-threonylcarbamoyladenylate synthase
MLIIKEEDVNAIELAIQFLQAGKLIAFATDTVYGIAADASNEKAVEQLYKIKNRQENKPIAIFINNLSDAKKIFKFGSLADKIAEKFLPGPLTMVLERQQHCQIKLASNLNHNQNNFLGFRLIDREFISNLLNKFSGTLAVTSANSSGESAAIDAKEVANYFQNHNILVIDGKITGNKIASTVIKISNNNLEILRHGAIEKEQLLRHYQ